MEDFKLIQEFNKNNTLNMSRRININVKAMLELSSDMAFNILKNYSTSTFLVIITSLPILRIFGIAT